MVGSTDPSYKDPLLPPLLRMDIILDPPHHLDIVSVDFRV